MEQEILDKEEEYQQELEAGAPIETECQAVAPGQDHNSSTLEGNVDELTKQVEMALNKIRGLEDYYE